MGEGQGASGRRTRALPPELLADVLDHLAEALVITERSPAGDRRVVRVNAAFVRLFGHDADVVVGADPWTLVGAETDPQALARLEAALAGDGVATTPVTLRHADGGVVRVLAHSFVSAGLEVTLLRDPHRSPVDAVGHHDEAWAQAIVSGLSDVVIVTDDEGVVTWASPSLTARLGYGVAEVVGTPCFDYLDPDQLDLAAMEWVETIAVGSRFSPVAFRVRHVDGTWRVMQISAAPLLDHPAVRGMVLTLTDLTDRAEAEERIAASERWAKTLIEGGIGMVAIIGHDGMISYASSSSVAVLGREPDELVGTVQFDLVHPEDRDGLADAFAGAIAGGPSGPHEFRVRHASGEYRVVSAMFTDLLDSPVIGGVVVNAHDVTGRHRAELLLTEQAEVLEAVARGAPLEITLQRVALMIEHLIEGAQVAVGTTDAGGRMRTRAAPLLPRAIVDLLDAVPADAPLVRRLSAAADTAATLLDLDDPVDLLGATDDVAAARRLFADAGLGQVRILVLHAPGTGEVLGALSAFVPDHLRLGPIETEVLARAANLASIAVERARFESTLEYQASFDRLTGLPNRAVLHTRIAEGLARSGRLGAGVAVVFIDLDRFKVINDSIGHARGDELLQLVAERLAGTLRPGDTLGRFGGDEFMVVCNRIADEEAARRAATRFSAVLSEPFSLGDGTVHVTASMGIAVSDDPDELPEALIRNADVALFRAKDSGRNQLQVFSEALDRSKVEQLAMEQALRAALDADEFELHFQPVVDLRDGAMVHAEALVRWHRPGHGLVMPGDFIPLAEETGLIVPLGWWVLADACARAASWPDLPGGRPMQIAVNLSARQLAAPDLVPTVRRVLADTGIAPERLCFEITESDLVRDVAAAVEAVTRLKDLGVLIAIDDFGTGYSSLDYLRQFTMADYLKIDRSFVDGVEKEGSQEAAIVTAAIGMAKSLGLQVVAEGVETLFQMEALRDLDCDLAQGFLFSRPVPVDDAIELMCTPR
ncbi:MAG: EAL domain-containing protein [Acidimicrobiales bacterium]|nr:EAL domain-containing protein [Acidimicrobiales bacterium]